MKALIGLGNPGKDYRNNRHNVGFKVIEELAVGCKVKLKRALRQKAWLKRVEIAGTLLLLVKPRVYMNRSGVCAARVLRAYKIPVEHMLIIYDDADLNPGELRIRRSGSSAGHKGIASVISALGTKEINRLKVGIGRPDSSSLTEYVLSDFSQEEENRIESAVKQAARLSLEWSKEVG